MPWTGPRFTFVRPWIGLRMTRLSSTDSFVSNCRQASSFPRAGGRPHLDARLTRHRGRMGPALRSARRPRIFLPFLRLRRVVSRVTSHMYHSAGPLRLLCSRLEADLDGNDGRSGLAPFEQASMRSKAVKRWVCGPHGVRLDQIAAEHAHGEFARSL